MTLLLGVCVQLVFLEGGGGGGGLIVLLMVDGGFLCSVRNRARARVVVGEKTRMIIRKKVLLRATQLSV